MLPRRERRNAREPYARATDRSGSRPDRARARSRRQRPRDRASRLRACRGSSIRNACRPSAGTSVRPDRRHLRGRGSRLRRLRSRGRLARGGRLVMTRGCRNRRRLRSREEEERVEVALGIRAAADAEVDVRHRQLRHAARADGADHLALGHLRAAPDAERAEVDEHDGVPVRCSDRHRLAARRHGSGKGNSAGGGGDDRRAGRGGDVDPAVLAGRVGVGAEGEWPQDRALHRPAPAERRSRDGQCREHRTDEQAHFHAIDLRCQI
jgi:hypothetical protein